MEQETGKIQFILLQFNRVSSYFCLEALCFMRLFLFQGPVAFATFQFFCPYGLTITAKTPVPHTYKANIRRLKGRRTQGSRYDMISCLVFRCFILVCVGGIYPRIGSEEARNSEKEMRNAKGCRQTKVQQKSALFTQRTRIEATQQIHVTTDQMDNKKKYYEQLCANQFDNR